MHSIWFSSPMHNAHISIEEEKLHSRRTNNWNNNINDMNGEKNRLEIRHFNQTKWKGAFKSSPNMLCLSPSSSFPLCVCVLSLCTEHSSSGLALFFCPVYFYLYGIHFNRFLYASVSNATQKPEALPTEMSLSFCLPLHLSLWREIKTMSKTYNLHS